MDTITKWKTATFILYLITFTLLLAALVGENWVEVRDQDGAHLLKSDIVVNLKGRIHGRHGLWLYCYENTHNCTEMDNFYMYENHKWFKAAQISAIISCFVALLALVSSFAQLWIPFTCGFMAASNMFLAFIAMIITCAIVSDWEHTNADKLIIKSVWGWTFIIGWISCLVSFIATIVGCTTMNKEYYDNSKNKYDASKDTEMLD